MNELRVEAGTVTLLRFYDVAYAIDLARVETLASSPARIRFKPAAAKSLSFAVPPVEFSVGPIQLALSEESLPCEAFARIYDFGVVAIHLRTVFSGKSWVDFSALTQRVAAYAETETESPLWQELLAQVHNVIAPAMERPGTSDLQEEYVIASVQSLSPPLNAREFMERVDLVPLLSGETRSLAESARAELVRHAHSYYENDLVVLTWDRAFMLDPDGASDVEDVIEVANAQLLELRFYDALLDAELPRMYDRVGESHKRLRGLGRNRYTQLARELHRMVADVTEITERVDNALKVTEDVYLARVYASALDLFRVRSWGAAVDRKLSIMRETYTMLYDEAATARAELLEIIIILLIAFEIVYAFVAG